MTPIAKINYIYNQVANSNELNIVHTESCELAASEEEHCKLGCFEHSYQAVERANRKLVGNFSGCRKCCSHLMDDFKQEVEQSDNMIWFAVDSTAIRNISWKNNTLHYHYKNRSKEYSYPYYSYQKSFLFDDFIRLLEYGSKGTYIDRLIKSNIKS